MSNVQPWMDEHNWFVLSTKGDGANAFLVPGDKLHAALHEEMCMCGKVWTDCHTEGVKEDVQSLNDRDNWTLDYPNYEPMNFRLSFEDGGIEIVRLTDTSFISRHAPTDSREQARNEALEEAAKAVAMLKDDVVTDYEKVALNAAVSAIRALKSRPQPKSFANELMDSANTPEFDASLDSDHKRASRTVASAEPSETPAPSTREQLVATMKIWEQRALASEERVVELKACNDSLSELIAKVWKALDPTGEYEGDKNLVDFARLIKSAEVSWERCYDELKATRPADSRQQALEEAAALCEQKVESIFVDVGRRLAKQIRALQSRPAASVEPSAEVQAAIDQGNLGISKAMNYVSELREAFTAMREALRRVKPYMEEAESKLLVGHEGCHWPVEAVRDALAQAEKVHP